MAQVEKALLSGLWQAETKEVTSMYFDSYLFTVNGKFVFNPNGYNGLNRVISIIGVFKLKGDTILLTPQYTKEITGGYPIRSEITTLSDTWEITSGKLQTIPVSKKITQRIICKKCEEDKCIIFDNRRFYKID
jgi:uncharacterized protein YxjI